MGSQSRKWTTSFQGQYKAILVDKNAYLLELTRYVVLNPVRAGMVRQVQDWPWSRRHAERKQAIIEAYATGRYSYQEIGAYFDLHFSTVGKIVRHARK